MPKIITLTSDWNNDDFYIGAVKGAIISSCSDCMVIDISHKIHSFNIAQAAYVLKQSFSQFPKGTVHVVAVNSDPDNSNPLLVAKYQGHYFLSCDNGVFGLLMDEKPEQLIKVKTESLKDNHSTFTVLDIFVDLAVKIVQGQDIASLGTSIDEYRKTVPILPAYDDTVINGSIIYIDSYGNAISNVSYELFQKVSKGRIFEITIVSNQFKIKKIGTTYQAAHAGDLVAVFNRAGMLEIALNNANAAQLLNISVKTSVRIKFFTEKPANELELSGD
jgi:S-adenosyl-L-methionine hydrolase (adenosine-forming)